MRKFNETKTGFDMYIFTKGENVSEYMADNVAMLKGRLMFAVCPVLKWELQTCLKAQASRGWV
jgi:hypothetical protein